MFKKIVTIIMALCFVSTLSFAGSSSTTNPIAGGGSSDYKSAHTYNDGAYSGGWSEGTAENYGSAGSFGLKTSTLATGKAKATGETDANAFAYDSGRTSIAGASNSTEVKVSADGTSSFSGKFGLGVAYNESTGRIEGNVYQCNYVNEVGYASGTFAQAQNHSGASFEGKTKDIGFAADASYRSFNGRAESDIRMSGSANTFGGSIATVDPIGKSQSAFAATGNISTADVRGANCDKTKVFGSGDVAVGAFTQANGNYASASGEGSFSYKGGNFGGGASVMCVTSHVGNNGSFSSQANGMSTSFTSGSNSNGGGQTPN